MSVLRIILELCWSVGTPHPIKTIQNKPTTNKWFALEINHFSVSYSWATSDIHKNLISAAVSSIFEESVNY